MKLYANQFKKSRVFSESVLSAILPQWKIIYDSPNPDVIFIPTKHDAIMLNRAIRMRLKFGWQPLMCVVDGEPRSLPQVDWLDYTFSHNATDSKNCHFPNATNLINIGDPQLFNSRGITTTQPKARFCNFIYSTFDKNRIIRNRFCRRLMEYKVVDCPGKAMNNVPSITGFGEPNAVQAKLDFMAKYKFTIAFENTSNDYYITEKIIHPFMVASVPIYWGCPKIAEYFNPESFINCHDYDSFAHVIERIKQIDNDPRLYQKYVDADPILPNSHFYEIRHQLQHRLTRIGKEVLQRRKSTYSNKLMSLWKTLMLFWENRQLICHHYLIDWNRKIRKYLMWLSDLLRIS